MSAISKSAQFTATRSSRTTGSPGHRPSERTARGRTSLTAASMRGLSSRQSTARRRLSTASPATVAPARAFATSSAGLSERPP